MKRLYKALAASFLAVAISGYTIKETKSNTDLDLYTSPSGTPAKAVSVSGTSGFLAALFGATVNTSTLLTGALNAPVLQVDKTTNGTMMLHRESADAGGATLEMLKRRSAFSVVTSGDRIATVAFSAADGTAAREAASIIGEVDGTPGASDMPGRLIFRTTADGSATPLERMRITNAGLIDLSQGTSTGIKLPSGGGTLSNYIGRTTWTPSLGPTSGSFTSVTYSTQSGHYSRTGDVVYVTWRINWSAANVGTGTGSLRTSLPVSAAAGVINDVVFTCSTTQLDTLGTAVRSPVHCLLNTSSSCDYYATGDNAIDSFVDPSLIGTGGFNKQIICSGHYYAN